MSTIKPSVAERFAEHVPYHRPLAEIESVAAAMGNSPVDNGTVEMIVCRPTSDERLVLQEGLLEATRGLRGDSWATRSAGTPDGNPDPLRQITLMNSRVARAIAGDRDRWQLAGDQLIVDFDLSIDNLPAGTHLRIGMALAEVTEPRTRAARSSPAATALRRWPGRMAPRVGSNGGAACTFGCWRPARCAKAMPSASCHERGLSDRARTGPVDCPASWWNASSLISRKA
jgi:hypothetical protein